jgi:protein subunit release factor A
VNGVPISLAEPKAPRLEDVFADAKGVPISIRFKSTGENRARLETIIDEFNLEKEKEELEQAKKELAKAKDESMRKAAQQKLVEAKSKLAEAIRAKRPEARRKLDALGFLAGCGKTQVE